MHYHVIVIEKHGDKRKGALCPTEKGARAEAAIEKEAGRDTDLEQCSQACFPELAPA